MTGVELGPMPPDAVADRLRDLFDEHGAALLRYLTRRVGPDAAQDLASEAFVVVVRNPTTRPAERGGDRAWLFGIANNLVRHHHRDRTRERNASERIPVTPDVDAGHEDGVAGRLDARRRVRTLASALRALPEDDRDVLLLVAWGALSPTEAAEALGIPAGTARSRLNRVRRQLRAELAYLEKEAER